MPEHKVCCGAASTLILLTWELDEEWPIRRSRVVQKVIGIRRLGQKVEHKSKSGSVSCISDVREWMPEDSLLEGGESSQKPDMIVWHSTFYQAPGFVIENLPAYGFIWICLYHSPFISWTLLSYFSLSSHHPSWLLLLLPYFDLLSHPPHSNTHTHTHTPIHSTTFLPLPHIIYLQFLPLSITPSLTSCFPVCQTVIINEKTIVPLALGSPLHSLA